MLRRGVVAFVLIGCLAQKAAGGTLSGSFAPVPEGSVIDLTAEGKVDWVHWGLHTESSLNRKSDVAAQISDFVPVYNDVDTNAYVLFYQYSDNFNGYSWTDGFPAIAVTNTPTGVWAYGWPSGQGSGFEISVPAGTTVQVLNIYVGSFAAEGLLEAFLTDGSAPPYSDTWLGNISNGPGRVYALRYSADSAGERLVVRWTFVRPRGISGGAANVTLQAATLSADNANNPPVVRLTAPTNNAQFVSGANIGLTADAYDADGTIARVEFWQGANKIGEDLDSPYEVAWNGAPAGHHWLTAKAVDNNDAIRTSAPAEIFVSGSGGSLSGSMMFPPSSVDLTSEGTADWAHWGLLPSPGFDRKSGVPAKIANFAVLGNYPVIQYTNGDAHPLYAWTDGAPTASESGTASGLYISGFTNGFEFTVPADTTPRQLKVYVGLYGAAGNFQVLLSDWSAPAYTDTSLDNLYDTSHAVYTLNYTAASAGQTLLVRYRSRKAYDMDYGNVALQSVTVQAPPGEKPVELINPAWSGGGFSFQFASEAGREYTVEFTETLSAESWEILPSISRDGTTLPVSDDQGTGGQRFYRVWAE